MISDVEHLFICLLAICPLWRSIEVLRPFFNWVGLFGFFGVEFVSSLSILDINPLSDVSANMFSYTVSCLFILLMFSFAVQKLFSLM